MLGKTKQITKNVSSLLALSVLTLSVTSYCPQSNMERSKFNLASQNKTVRDVASVSAVKLQTNCLLPQQLPIATHWNNTRMVNPGDTQQIAIDNPKLPYLLQQPAAIKYIYNFNFLPTIQNYGVTNFSLKAIPNKVAQTWVQNLCRSTGQAFQFKKPAVFNGTQAISTIISSTPRKSGIVYIISGLTVSKSMFTVFLPANWNPQNSYPIIFNGFYDINENLFNHEGIPVGALVAKSAQNNGTGAIGLLWNGGGAFASRTVNPQAFGEFQKVINLVAQLGGDRNRIIAFGGSRGGMTALQMASNPYPHKYIIRYVDAAVPATHLGTVAEVTSPTIPTLLSAADWTVGLADAHKNSFVYPKVGNGNGLQGLTGTQAHLKILTGTANPRVVDAYYSIGSPAYIRAIKSAGTQVFLELSSHDHLVPSFDQLWLYNQYVQQKIPVELKYNYLAGHADDRGLKFRRLERQMRAYTHNTGTRPMVQNRKIQFFKVNNSGALVPSLNTRFLFTLEVPRYLSPEVNGVIVSTGMPYTEVELTIRFPNNDVQRFYPTLNAYGFNLLKFSPRSIPVGVYQVVQVRIRNKGQANWRLIPLNNRSYKMTAPNEPLLIENLAEHPAGYTGATTADAIKNAYLGGSRERARGVFKGVSYGIVEPGL